MITLVSRVPDTVAFENVHTTRKYDYYIQPLMRRVYKLNCSATSKNNFSEAEFTFVKGKHFAS